MADNVVDDHAANFVERIKSTAGNLADDAKSKVESLVSQATGAAEHAYGQARAQLRDATEGVTTSVEQQPVVAMIVVGFVGLLVGFLLGRH
jgi:ElaB/YqjD/DUF883 family membrane-anchored ribosome-binding protein